MRPFKKGALVHGLRCESMVIADYSYEWLMQRQREADAAGTHPDLSRYETIRGATWLERLRWHSNFTMRVSWWFTDLPWEYGYRTNPNIRVPYERAV